jgi:hypothetical protein
VRRAAARPLCVRSSASRTSPHWSTHTATPCGDTARPHGSRVRPITCRIAVGCFRAFG